MESNSLQEKINEIQSKIESTKFTLQQQEYTLNFLLDGVNQEVEKNDAITSDDFFDVSACGGVISKRTILDEIKDALPKFGDQEFNVTNVEVLTNRLSIKIPGQSPKARISSVLTKLTVDGFLVRTFTGSGNVPHLFRIRKEGEEKTLVKASRKKESISGENESLNQESVFNVTQ